ncbi:MAG: tetratricopeptide repeat protein [Bdellovibrionota bacterium]
MAASKRRIPFLFLLALFFALPAHAQERRSIDDLLNELPPETAAPAEAPAATTPGEEGAASSIDQLLEQAPEGAATGESLAAMDAIQSPEELAAIWSRLRAGLDQRQYSAVTAEITNLQQARLDLGVRNLSYVSNALLELARQAAAKSDKELAARLVQAAEQLSPDLSGPSFARAEMAGGDKGAFLSDWFGGYRRSLDSLPAYLAWSGYLRLTLAFALLGAALLLCLALAFRYLHLLSHDLSHLLKIHKSKSLAAKGAVILLLLTPLALGWGPLAIAPVWIAAFFLYMTPAERGASAAVLAALLLVPFLAADGEKRVLASRSPVLLDTTAAFEGVWSADLQKRLEAHTAAKPASEASQFALALVLTKARQTEEAQKRWNEVLALAPSRWQAHNNLAIAYLQEGKTAEAAGAFQKAASLAPQEAVPNLNLSLALEIQGDAASAQAALGRARAADPLALARWEAQGKGLPPARRIVFEPLSRQEMLALFPAFLDETLQAGPARAVLGPGLPQSPAVFLGVVIFAVLLLTLLHKRFHPATECERCGEPIGARESGAQQSRTTCSQCIAAFFRKQVTDSEARIRKLAEIERYQSRRRWLTRFLSLLFPGCGSMSQGAVFVGLALAVPALVILVGAFVFLPLVPAADPSLLEPAAPWPFAAAAVPALAILYALGALLGFKGD